jgi:hypothetical protein
MLMNIERQAGWRSRKILEEAGLSDIAGLSERIRTGKPAVLSDEALRLKRRAGELSREMEAARLAWTKEKFPSGDFPTADQKKILAAFETAEKRYNEAARAAADARHKWEPQRTAATKQIVYDNAATIAKAFSIIAGALEGEAELRILAGLAEEVELPQPMPVDADTRVVFAVLRVIGQALDELHGQSAAVGLRFGSRRERPSATLGRLVAGMA